MKTIRVSAQLHAALGAWNRRDVGRGIRKPVATHPDGTVDWEVGEDVVARIEALARPGETQEDTLRRLLWTSKPGQHHGPGSANEP